MGYKEIKFIMVEGLCLNEECKWHINPPSPKEAIYFDSEEEVIRSGENMHEKFMMSDENNEGYLCKGPLIIIPIKAYKVIA